MRPGSLESLSRRKRRRIAAAASRAFSATTLSSFFFPSTNACIGHIYPGLFSCRMDTEGEEERRARGRSGRARAHWWQRETRKAFVADLRARRRARAETRNIMGHVFGRAALMTPFRGALDAPHCPCKLFHAASTTASFSPHCEPAHVLHSRGLRALRVSLDFLVISRCARSARIIGVARDCPRGLSAR